MNAAHKLVFLTTPAAAAASAAVVLATAALGYWSWRRSGSDGARSHGRRCGMPRSRP